MMDPETFVIRDKLASLEKVLESPEPEKSSIASVLIGVWFMLHVTCSVILFYLRLSGMWGSYSLAMFPLMLLSIEMVGVSLAGGYWALTSGKDSCKQL